MGAEIRAQGARKRATEAAREADRAEAEAWSLQWKPLAALRSRRRPSRNVLMVDSAGLRWNATAARPSETTTRHADLET
jgi:hypothetical protein